MSRLTINGVTIWSSRVAPVATAAPTVATTVATVAPSWATHRLVDGQWVPKGTPAVTTTARPIGFAVGATDATPATTHGITVDGRRRFSSRKAALRAIELAAAEVLRRGTDAEAIGMLRRGRLGGRKDTLASLHKLLDRYTSGH